MGHNPKKDNTNERTEEAIRKLMEQNPDLSRDDAIEAIEDAGLAAAIMEDESSGLVDRAEIDAILKPCTS